MVSPGRRMAVGKRLNVVSGYLVDLWGMLGVFFIYILKYFCVLNLKSIFFLDELLKNSYFEVIYDEMRTKTRSY